MKVKQKEEPQVQHIPEEMFQPDFVQEEKVDQNLVDLHELLSELDPDHAPLLSVLEAWKSKHKSLFTSKISMSSDEYYVFTTIKRKDFKILQETGVFDNEEKGNEVLVEKCLLYPRPTSAWRLTSAAGIITTLGKQIAYKSGFVSPQEAISLIKVI